MSSSANGLHDFLTYQVPFEVTLGGVAFGASLILGYAIYWWYREKHKLGRLVPFLLAQAYGMLAVLTAGGVLGAVGWLALWSGNGIGYIGLVYGVGGTDANVTRTSQLVLTPGGHVIVLLLTVALACLWLWAPKIRNWKLAVGALSGVALGLSGTLAGIAAVPLASGVNLLGLPFTDML